MNGLAGTAATVPGGQGARSALRVLGLSAGADASALSGVPNHLFAALARRSTVVGRVDYGLRGPARLAMAAVSFRPRRHAWRARFNAGLPAQRALSANLAWRSRGLPPFDVAVQVLGWVAGQPRPYVLYVDQTRLMAERGWPQWLPLGRRERTAVLRRERAMYAEAAHVFTMGGPARDSLVEDYGVPADRVTVVGGGLNLPSLPDAHDPAGGAAEVLFIGREYERKGGDCLDLAFERVRERVPEARLHRVGAGPARHEVLALHRRARVFCMPSRYEPYGLALVEAMAHGVPCVGTTVQSIPEILGHGQAGLLVPPGEPEALAEALVRLLTDDELARRLGGRGRELVEEGLLWDHVAERMLPGLLRAAGRDPAEMPPAPA